MKAEGELDVAEEAALKGKAEHTEARGIVRALGGKNALALSEQRGKLEKGFNTLSALTGIKDPHELAAKFCEMRGAPGPTAAAMARASKKAEVRRDAAYAAVEEGRGELERRRLGGGAGRAGAGYAEMDRVDSAVAASTRRLR